MEDTHVFTGMRRDNHPIKQPKEYLWDARNIRLTTRDGDTMLSITNEKGTKLLVKYGSIISYVGHVVLGEWLVLFLVSTAGTSYIRRVKPEEGIDELLYSGTDLHFDAEHPIQAIGDYESELVQKVYWVDGINSPRVINIAKPELTYPDADERASHYNISKGFTSLYKDAPFGFVQDLKLEEKVSVERLSSSVGSFPAGVVQYALTYCHKYGQESNIFYTSELLYTSFSERGGSPEDKVSTAFRLSIENIDTKFQYIRVYSIMRTSIDAVPTVKRVADIDISNAIEDNTISIVDNNTTGDIVDPAALLYVGGKDITASCITSKDNVLFLGDITYNRKSIYDLKLTSDDMKLPGVTIQTEDRNIILSNITKDYLYSNQLSINTSTFKHGETYRLGCRFQYKNGEWSEPLWINDYVYDHAPRLADNGILLGKIKATLPGEVINTVKSAGYKKVQAIIAMPQQKDRTIIAQGVLCPTVGQVGNRVNGGGPYAQSSWLIRPWSDTGINGDGYSGSIPAYEHNRSLAFGAERCVELQTMALEAEDASGFTSPENSKMYTMSYDEMANAKDENEKSSEGYYGAFVVDQSIVSMYSPDIEFGDIFNVLNSGNELQLHQVGSIRFDSNRGDIDIQTSTPVIDGDAAGFIKRGLTGEGARSLISGLFYEDSGVDDVGDSGQFGRHLGPRLWMTYMWHRNGSLNNDCVRPDGAGTRTSMLRTKKIVNLKISNTIKYDTSKKLNTFDIQHFNSNEVTLIRLKNAEGNTIPYYGNVDTLIPAYQSYSFACTRNELAGLEETAASFSGEAIVGGQTGVFSIHVIDLQGSNSFVSSESVVAGVMPYIVDTTTTISSNVSTSTSGGEETADPDTNSSSNTTITSTGSKITTVDVVGKARLDIYIENGRFSGTVTLTEDSTTREGEVVPKNYTWSISGNTTYKPKVRTKKGGFFNVGHRHTIWESSIPKFTGELLFIANSGMDDKLDELGDDYEALKLSKEGVRMKYKTAPHAVISLESPLEALSQGSLYLVELRQNIDENLRYGGKTKEALLNNIWIPAGPAVSIDKGFIEYLWGDTWFQRYDFLKTYPFTFEDQNQVTEIGSFFCETRVNIDGRYDRNRGSTSFSLSPVNFNLYNPVYSQLNSFFNTRMVDEDYYKVTNYPSQLMWTLAKNPSAIQDAWTNLHTANSLDLDGANGRLINVCPLNELLIGFQENGISQILFNSRVQIEASDGVPIEIANSQKVEGTRVYSSIIGCQDKFAMVTTPEGIYFMDNAKHQIYLFGGDGSIQNLGLQLGTLYWPRENYSPNTWRFSFNNTSNKINRNGIRLCYDSKFQDVYFIPGNDQGVLMGGSRPALCFNEQLAQFTSLMDYGGSVLFFMNSKFYAIARDTSLADNGNLCLWECFAGDYNSFFGSLKPFSFSFISNDNSTYNKVFDTIEMRTDQYKGDVLLGDKYSTRVQEAMPLNYIRADNEYQDTGTVAFNAATMRKKFRVWRAQIPRNRGTRQRIRNPWTKITLGNSSPGANMTILHDLSVKYTL